MSKHHPDEPRSESWGNAVAVGLILIILGFLIFSGV